MEIINSKVNNFIKIMESYDIDLLKGSYSDEEINEVINHWHSSSDGDDKERIDMHSYCLLSISIESSLIEHDNLKIFEYLLSKTKKSLLDECYSIIDTEKIAYKYINNIFGNNILFRNNKFNFTPLQTAIIFKRKYVAKKIIDTDHNINTYSTSIGALEIKFTALSLAILSNNYDICKMLIENKRLKYEYELLKFNHLLKIIRNACYVNCEYKTQYDTLKRLINGDVGSSFNKIYSIYPSYFTLALMTDNINIIKLICDEYKEHIFCYNRILYSLRVPSIKTSFTTVAMFAMRYIINPVIIMYLVLIDDYYNDNDNFMSFINEKFIRYMFLYSDVDKLTAMNNYEKPFLSFKFGDDIKKSFISYSKEFIERIIITSSRDVVYNKKTDEIFKILITYGCMLNLDIHYMMTYICSCLKENRRLFVLNDIKLHNENIIFYCIYKGNIKLIELMLDCGIDTSSKNSKNLTLMEYAKLINSSIKIIECLEKYKCD
jgi:ankyrin repeat protein